MLHYVVFHLGLHCLPKYSFFKGLMFKFPKVCLFQKNASVHLILVKFTRAILIQTNVVLFLFSKQHKAKPKLICGLNYILYGYIILGRIKDNSLFVKQFYKSN